jgi:hypothetical protein
MNRLIGPVLIFVFIHIGCAPSVELMRIDSSDRPPKTGEIDVYMSAQSIDRPYKEIGRIKVTESVYGNADQVLIDKLVLHAKKLGADGVVILTKEFFDDWWYVHWDSDGCRQEFRKVLRGSAIVYEEE